MIGSKKNIFFGIGGGFLFLFFAFLYFSFVSAEQGSVSFTIVGIGIRHGTPNNVNLGFPTTSGSNQEISGQFDGSGFWVEDLEGYATGHYTTIQCDGIYGSAGNKLTGIYLKAGNTIPTLIRGFTGNVFISSLLSDYTSILTPVTYIYKPTNINNTSIINTYADNPRLKIFIPGGTPPGTYSGTIVFSLYMY